jgi:hypothetical protein
MENKAVMQIHSNVATILFDMIENNERTRLLFRSDDAFKLSMIKMLNTKRCKSEYAMDYYIAYLIVKLLEARDVSVPLVIDGNDLAEYFDYLEGVVRIPNNG